MASISPKKAVELILKEVEIGKTFTDTWQVISSKNKLDESTFAKYWKQANLIYDKKQEAIQKKKDARREAHELAYQEHILETKDGQVQELIKHALAINEEIQSGKAKCFNWFRGQFNEMEVTLTHSELAEKRKVLALLLGDIRKIRGLDAEAKSQTTLSIDDQLRQWLEQGLMKPVSDNTPIQDFEMLK